MQQGQPISGYLGTWLDKITKLRISIKTQGMHTWINPLSAALTYGGISYIRNEHPGHYENIPTNGLSVLQDEWTSWSTRYWYLPTDASLWRSTDEVIVWPAQLATASSDEVPGNVQDITQLKERSVAATDWKLLIPYYLKQRAGGLILMTSKISISGFGTKPNNGHRRTRVR